jgi:HEAT repeat protein
MKSKFLLFFVFSAALMSTVAAAQNQFVDPQAAAKANAHEDELYSNGTQNLNDGKYDDAIGKFDQIVAMHGRRADGALYWKAYALNKAARKPEALATIAQLRKEYPQSKWLRDAGALEIDARGGNVNPDQEPDEDLKIYAVDGLMQSEPEKAFPILEKILQGNGSERLKERALFVLSQSRSEKAQQLLLSVAKGSNQPDLQRHAIKYLGISGSRNVGLLQQIYTSSSDPEVKGSVLNAFLIAGAKENVLAVARQEKSPELRRKAIHTLGAMGARTEIRQFYKEATDAETKENLLQGMMIGGDSQGLIEASKSETNPEARRKAIELLGVIGSDEALGALMSIYNTQTDLESRKHALRGLFIHQDSKDLITLARKETNPELKKDIVRYLSLIHSPDATEYMMEILK